MIVDTHAHIYSEDTARYPLCADPYLPPTGTGTLSHLRGEMERNGVDRVVMVHTFTAYRWDNRLVADVVRECREFATGVCALNPNDPGSPSTLERYHQECGIRGLRVFPVEGPDGVRSFELTGHVALWEKCAELGIVVCALINPPEIPALRRMLERFPGVPVVLDHCANLAAGDAPDSGNLRSVLALAGYPNLHAKLSFVVTGSDGGYPCEDTLPLARKVIEAFGPERCTWGSDFPCELWIPRATYAEHLRLFTQEIDLDPAGREAVLGGTARRLWFS